MAESTEGGLSGQLARIETKLNELEAASRRNKITSRVISLAIAIVAVLMVWLMISPLLRAINEPEPYRERISAGFQERIIPKVMTEGKAMYDELQPVYAETFEKVHSERGDDVIMALENEASALIENVGTDVRLQMSEFQEEFERHQLERLKKEFPQLADEKRAAIIVEKVATSSQNVVERLVVDLFSEHQEAISRLEMEFNQIEVPEEIQSMSPEEIEEHVSALVFELLVMKLNAIRTGEAVTLEAGEMTEADIIPADVVEEAETATDEAEQ